MGLSVHYEWRCKTQTAKAARDVVERLRQRALELPFFEVGPMHVVAPRGKSAGAPNWLTEAIDWMSTTRHGRELLPDRAFACRILPGPGCEPAVIGLAKYPDWIETARGRRIATKLPGWFWVGSCKTQYASNPRHGGIENFVRCHTSLIVLLDAASELGLTTTISDEGGFFQHRDVERLRREVAGWNELVAGFVGRLKDISPAERSAPIAADPDFEHLEVRGRPPTGSGRAQALR